MSNIRVLFTDRFGNVEQRDMQHAPSLGEQVKVFDYMPVPKVVNVAWLLIGEPADIDVLIELD